MQRIGIVDYQMGNLRNVAWAFEHFGKEVTWVTSPNDIAAIDVLVLPGVGAFGRAMTELTQMQLIVPIKTWIAQQRPFLGVCLGFQLLFEASDEAPGIMGLAVLPGHITKLSTSSGKYKVPHMGWNTVETKTQHSSALMPFANHYFYFVHSYAAPSTLPIPHLTTTYGDTFTSAIADKNLWGAQFHPERSGQIGRQFIATFLEQAQCV